jgi:hypothetical protein
MAHPCMYSNCLVNYVKWDILAVYEGMFYTSACLYCPWSCVQALERHDTLSGTYSKNPQEKLFHQKKLCQIGENGALVPVGAGLL